MSQRVTVTQYDPNWKNIFEKEAALISDVLKDNLVSIHHIGSTSIKGLAAKPIIDIMPVVKDLKAVDSLAHLFEAAGYEYMGEFGIENRRYLRKGGDERTHQIHIFEQSDNYNIERHLAFRDYMRTHPKERDAYAVLKTKLAEKYPYDIESYCDGKEAFVKAVEKQALEWYKNKR